MLVTKRSLRLSVSLLFLSIILTACGGSSGGGDPIAAPIDDGSNTATTGSTNAGEVTSGSSTTGGTTDESGTATAGAASTDSSNASDDGTATAADSSAGDGATTGDDTAGTTTTEAATSGATTGTMTTTSGDTTAGGTTGSDNSGDTTTTGTTGGATTGNTERSDTAGTALLVTNEPWSADGSEVSSLTKLYSNGTNALVVSIGSLEPEGVGKNILLRGPFDQLQRSLDSGTVLLGVPANARFSFIEGVSVDTNGELAGIVTLTGSSAINEAVLISNAEDYQVIMRKGDRAVGFVGDTTISNLISVQRSTAGTLIHGTISRSNADAIWFWDNVSMRLIASSAPSFVADDLIADGGCAIGLNGNINATIAHINDLGQIVFEAKTVDPVTGFQSTECGQKLLYLYQANDAEGLSPTTQRIVTTGDAIDDNVKNSISQINTVMLNNSGVLLVRVFVEKDLGRSRVDRNSVYMTIDLSNASRNLILAESETLPPEYITGFSGFTSKQGLINVASQVVLQVDTSRNSVNLKSSGYGNQPYADIFEVGQSNMELVASTSSAAPPGYPETVFYKEFNQVLIAGSGSVYFLATIRDAADSSYVLNALWQSDENGAVSKRLAVGDFVAFNDTVAEVVSFDYSRFNRLDQMVQIEEGVFVRVGIRVPSANDSFRTENALVFVPAQ